MNVVDENIVASERERLQSWKIHFRVMMFLEILNSSTRLLLQQLGREPLISSL
jgi:hypothetical protein